MNKKSIQLLNLNWRITDQKIEKIFKFSSFSKAVEFMHIVFELAESQNHHPELHNSYRQVIVSLTTHEAGNRVSEKDFIFAETLEQKIK